MPAFTRHSRFYVVSLMVVMTAVLVFMTVGSSVQARDYTKGSVFNDSKVESADNINLDLVPVRKSFIPVIGYHTKLKINGVPTESAVNNGRLIHDPKGQFTATYTNIASYKDEIYDFKITVGARHKHWDPKAQGGEWMFFGKSNNISGDSKARITFSQGGYDYIKLRGQYVLHGTNTPASNVQGSYMTMSDFDSNQFVSFSSSMHNSMNGIYAWPNSHVSHWRSGGKYNYGGMVNKNISPFNKKHWTTFAVDGNSFNFDWAKDWSQGSMNNNAYNTSKKIDYKDQQHAQMFQYTRKKSFPTEIPPIFKTSISPTKLELNDDVHYRLMHIAPNETGGFRYKRYKITDQINPLFELSASDVHVENVFGDDMTDRFDIHVSSDNQVTIEARHPKSDAFNGETYFFHINANVGDDPGLLKEAKNKAPDNTRKFNVYNKAHLDVERVSGLDIPGDDNHQVSNTVTNRVELPYPKVGFNHFSIYTDNYDEGLDAYLKPDVKKKAKDKSDEEKQDKKEAGEEDKKDDNDAYHEIYKDEPIDIVVRKNGSKEVVRKDMTLGELSDMSRKDIKMLISEDKAGFHKNDTDNYVASFENYDPDRIDTGAGEGRDAKIDTDGHTASEAHIERDLTARDEDATETYADDEFASSYDAVSKYDNIVMTERHAGEKMQRHYEYLTLPLEHVGKIKTGYGVQLDRDVEYENDLYDDDRVDDYYINTAFHVAPSIVDDSLYDDDGNSNGLYMGKPDNGLPYIEMIGAYDDFNDGHDLNKHDHYRFQVPGIDVKHNSGELTFFEGNSDDDASYREQYRQHSPADGWVAGGQKFYLPIWMQNEGAENPKRVLGDYTMDFRTQAPVGVNDVTFNIHDDLTVDAYMYDHIDSENEDKSGPRADELLIKPAKQEDIDDLFSAGD